MCIEGPSFVAPTIRAEGQALLPDTAPLVVTRVRCSLIRPIDCCGSKEIFRLPPTPQTSAHFLASNRASTSANVGSADSLGTLGAHHAMFTWGKLQKITTTRAGVFRDPMENVACAHFVPNNLRAKKIANCRTEPRASSQILTRRDVPCKPTPNNPFAPANGLKSGQPFADNAACGGKLYGP
jgi:hypothetical protein